MESATFVNFGVRVDIPGCSVESTIFFALHKSGVIDCSCPFLYAETSFFACSRPAAETKRVLKQSICKQDQKSTDMRLSGVGMVVIYLPHCDMATWSTRVSHLGSAIWADCLTRPQYVLRSYCDAGRSRAPGREADMAACIGYPRGNGSLGKSAEALLS